MPLVNTIAIAAISEREVLPISVIVEDLPESGAHTVVSVERISGDAEVTITSLGIMQGRTLTLTNLWLDDETPAPGRHRVRCIVQSADTSIRVEVNLMFEIRES